MNSQCSFATDGEVEPHSMYQKYVVNNMARTEVDFSHSICYLRL